MNKSQPKIHSESDLPEWKLRIIESRQKKLRAAEIEHQQQNQTGANVFGVQLKDPDWMDRLKGNRSDRQGHAQATNFGSSVCNFCLTFNFIL
jgi:hypothetical protein